MGGVGPWRFPSSELDHGGEVFTFSPSPKGAPSCSHDEMEDACPLAQGGENVEGSSESEACRTEVLLQAPKAGGDGWNVCNLKNDRMISARFQGKPFSITVIQVYAPTSNTEEAEAPTLLSH